MLPSIDISKSENEAQRSQEIAERAVNMMITEGTMRAAVLSGGSPGASPATTNAQNESYFVFGEALVDEDNNGRPLAPSS